MYAIVRYRYFVNFYTVFRYSGFFLGGIAVSDTLPCPPPKVHEEYERLHHINSRLQPQLLSAGLRDSQAISICLLNVRSLKKHSRDLSIDPILSKCDVLALTETQLFASVPNDEISSILEDFSVYCQDHDHDKFSSLAVCYKRTTGLYDTEYFHSVNGLKFSINNSASSVNMLSCLLLYRKHGGDIRQFISSMEYVIRNCDIDLIFGDFNIDYFHDNNISPLKNLFESLLYVQLVSKPTFVSSGSLLDHVYVKKSISHKINTDVVSVYYSDHEAIMTIVSS